MAKATTRTAAMINVGRIALRRPLIRGVLTRYLLLAVPACRAGPALVSDGAVSVCARWKCYSPVTRLRVTPQVAHRFLARPNRRSGLDRAGGSAAAPRHPGFSARPCEH